MKNINYLIITPESIQFDNTVYYQEEECIFYSLNLDSSHKIITDNGYVIFVYNDYITQPEVFLIFKINQEQYNKRINENLMPQYFWCDDDLFESIDIKDIDKFSYESLVKICGKQE